MKLLLFWFKIFITRIYKLIKISPILLVALTIIMISLIITNTMILFIINRKQFNIIILAIYLITLMNSFNKIDVIKYFIIYSNTKYSNRNIKNIIAVGKSLFSDIPLLLFYILKLANVIQFNFIINHFNLFFIGIILLLCLFSIANRLLQNKYITMLFIVLELVLIYAVLYKDGYFIFIGYLSFGTILLFLLFKMPNEDINKDNNKNIIRIYPYLKSTIYDYITSSFLQPAVIVISIFLYIVFEYLGSPENIDRVDTPLISVLLGLLSICLYLIIDSVPNTNWMFYSIIKPDFKFQITRILIFLLLFFSPLFIIIIYFIITQEIHHILNYIYFIIINILFSISISFYICNKIIKGFLAVICILMSIYINVTNPMLIYILTIPLILSMIKSKNDHYGWYYIS